MITGFKQLVARSGLGPSHWNSDVIASRVLNSAKKSRSSVLVNLIVELIIELPCESGALTGSKPTDSCARGAKVPVRLGGHTTVAGVWCLS